MESLLVQQEQAKLVQVFGKLGWTYTPNIVNGGLASYLVNRSTLEILGRGGVPIYDVIASNIASQRVAQRSGYTLGWVSDWKCNFEGLEA